VPEVPWNESCANPITLKWVQDAANYLYGYTSSQISNVEQSCNFILDYYGNTPTDLGSTYPYLEGLLEVVGGSGGASGCVVGTANTNSNTGEMTGCTVGATSTGSTTNPDTNAPQGSLTLYPTATGSGWPKPSWQTNSNIPGLPSDGVRDLPDVSFFAADGYVSSSAYLICVSQEGSCSYSSLSEPYAQEVGGTSVATPAMAGVMALINQKTGAAQGLAAPGLYTLAAKQGESGYGSCSAENGKTTSSCYFNDIDEYTSAQPCDAADSTPNCVATSSTLGSSDAQNGLGILTGYSAGTGYDLASGLGSLNVANVVNAWPSAVGSSAATVTFSTLPATIPSSQSLTVTVTVASVPSGGTTPTGTVTLSSGTYNSGAQPLNGSGSYTFNIPGGSLSVGIDTLTAAYSGDSNYAAVPSTTATITVTAASGLIPTVTVSPVPTTLNSDASLSVPVTVTGSGPTPTGTVTLSSGSYNSGAQMLASGAYTFTIPANSLAGGTDTLTVMYSGDSNYSTASGTATVTVNPSAFTLTTPPITVSPSTIAPGASATATVTVASSDGYAGTVTLTCALQSTTAAGGGDVPNCTGGGSPGVTLTGGTSRGTVAFTITTTAASNAALVYPKMPGNGRGWQGAGGGAVLAFLVFLGIPARRRSWRAMVGMMLLMAALGGMTACGGSSTNGGGGGGTNDPGTLAGTYTFQVNATGTPSASVQPVTFTVTVN
jgi:hypothetical protein